MLWKFIAGVVAVALMAVASVAKAAPYVDATFAFRVAIPERWTWRKDDSNGDLIATSPDTNTTFGYCFVHTIVLPRTNRMPQADINQQLAGKFPASYWQTSFEQAGFKDVVVEASGDEIQNGRRVHYAVLTYKERRKAHRFKTVVHTVPGRQHHLTCNAYLDAYAREKAAFETFFGSFTPIEPAPKN